MWVCKYMFGFIVFAWACTWIFEVNVSDNQNCEPGWEDIQAAICELKLLFFVFCIWCIDAGTYDFFIFLTLASFISLAIVIATFLFQPPVPPSPPILTLSLLDMALVSSCYGYDLFSFSSCNFHFFFLLLFLTSKHQNPFSSPFLLAFSHIQTPKPNWIELKLTAVKLVWYSFPIGRCQCQIWQNRHPQFSAKLPSTPTANWLHPLMFEL